MDEYITWPGGTDPDLYFMLKRNQMKYLCLGQHNWVIKSQPVNELAKRRNVNLDVKIPRVTGTGLVENDRCVYVRTITKSNNGHFIAPRCQPIVPQVHKMTLDEYFVNLLVM